MALLTLADVLNECADEIPGKAVQQAQIVRALNKVLRRIQTEFVEPTRMTFTTRVATTSGTVNATQDSTAVTFSGTPLLSTDPLMLIQIQGESTFFILTYASTSTGTLSSKWAQATNATATYTIVYPTVSFPATVGEVVRVQQYGYEPLNFRLGGTCPWLTGIPTSWSPYYHDEQGTTPNDDLTRIFLDPAPADRFVFEAWVKPRTARFFNDTATTETIPFSDLWWEAITEGVKYFAFKQTSETDKAMLQSALYEGALQRARGAALPAAVVHRTRRADHNIIYETRPIVHD